MRSFILRMGKRCNELRSDPGAKPDYDKMSSAYGFLVIFRRPKRDFRKATCSKKNSANFVLVRA
jgi:hypothetical protein